MSVNGKYNPYHRPTPYEVLELKQGPGATAKEIGKAVNDQKKKAKRIKDTIERAKRLEELDSAKDRLLRPDDRVLFDFFILGDQVFAEICRGFGRRITGDTLNTDKVVGHLYPSQKYDDLVPEVLDKVPGELKLVESPEFYTALEAERVRLPLTEIDL
jgi:hypothetical protein